MKQSSSDFGQQAAQWNQKGKKKKRWSEARRSSSFPLGDTLQTTEQGRGSPIQPCCGDRDWGSQKLMQLEVAEQNSGQERSRLKKNSSQNNLPRNVPCSPSWPPGCPRVGVPAGQMRSHQQTEPNSCLSRHSVKFPPAGKQSPRGGPRATAGELGEATPGVMPGWNPRATTEEIKEST